MKARTYALTHAGTHAHTHTHAHTDMANVKLTLAGSVEEYTRTVQVVWQKMHMPDVCPEPTPVASVVLYGVYSCACVAWPAIHGTYDIYGQGGMHVGMVSTA